MATACGYTQTLGLVSLTASMVQPPFGSGSRSQDLPLASSSGGCLCCDAGMTHRPSQHPAPDPPGLPQAGTTWRSISKAWLEWLSSASSVRPFVWELAGVRTRRVPSADVQLYSVIDPVSEGVWS